MPGSALATLCRRVIQIGSLNESHVLPAPSYQTSAFDGRSIPAVCDPCIDGVPPRALLRVTQSQGSDRAGTMEWLFLFDGDFCCLDYRNTASPSFRFIRSTEPVVIIDVTIPAAVRMTTSDTTLSEVIFSIVPGRRVRILMVMVIVTPVHGCSMLWSAAAPLVMNP